MAIKPVDVHFLRPQPNRVPPEPESVVPIERRANPAIEHLRGQRVLEPDKDRSADDFPETAREADRLPDGIPCLFFGGSEQLLVDPYDEKNVCPMIPETLAPIRTDRD